MEGMSKQITKKTFFYFFTPQQRLEIANTLAGRQIAGIPRSILKQGDFAHLIGEKTAACHANALQPTWRCMIQERQRQRLHTLVGQPE